jgi:single-stranded-DNA-specific exonuclease
VESLEALRERLRAYAAERLTPEDMRPVVEIDAVLELQDVNEDLWSALERIAPFGMDNERPLFALRGAQLTSPPQLWKDKHLRIAVRQGGRSVILKGFGMGAKAPELNGVTAVDVAFEIERDWYGGLGLIARECRPCQAAAGA